MRSTSTLSLCLIGVLAIALSASVEAAENACQVCYDDVRQSYPQCKGVEPEDRTSTSKSFNEFSSANQACMCAIGYDTSPFMKCNPLCPPNNMGLITRGFEGLAATFCKPDGSGPLNSSSSSASSLSCLHLASVAAAIVFSAVALA